METKHTDRDLFDLCGLTRIQVQTIAAALQIMSYQWARELNNNIAAKMARDCNDIASHLIMTVFASPITREKYNNEARNIP